MNADGSGQRRLTHLAAHNTSPVWLPDGKITFVSFHGPNDFEIYVINADGSGQRNLTREWGLDGLPVWRPDGQKIAFASKRDGNWELYVMNADGSEQRNLTRNAANDYLYAAQPWSPDGRKIVFGRDRNGDGGSDAHLRHQRRRQRRAEPDTRAGTSLVTRRAEDHLHEQARKLGRDLRHERRRQRTAEADTQPGEKARENGQRLACLVARAEVESFARHASVVLAPSGQEHGALHERTQAQEAIGDKDNSAVEERTLAWASGGNAARRLRRPMIHASPLSL